MLKTVFTLLMATTLLSVSYGQVNDYGQRLEVLRHHTVGQQYKFYSKTDHSTTLLRYLGKVKTDNGVCYKIMTSVWLWGQSHRATSRILVYDSFNRYIGQYHVDMTYDLPNHLKANRLVFLNSNKTGSDCDLTLVTEIDLSAGLPKQIFIRCKGDEGDLYPFESEGE